MKLRNFLGTLSALALSSTVLAGKKAEEKTDPKPALIDQSKCIHCGTCFKNCPVKAIDKNKVDDTDVYTIDPKKCISCGTCIKNCPVKAISWRTPAVDSLSVD
jgi:ferredoxin